MAPGAIEIGGVIGIIIKGFAFSVYYYAFSYLIIIIIKLI